MLIINFLCGPNLRKLRVEGRINIFMCSSAKCHVLVTLRSCDQVPSEWDLPYNICSVSHIYIHPALANNADLNMPAFEGVNTSNVAGTPVDPLAVVNAQSTVELLTGARSICMLSSHFCPQLTTRLLRESSESSDRGCHWNSKNCMHVLRNTCEAVVHDLVLPTDITVMDYRHITGVWTATRLWYLFSETIRPGSPLPWSDGGLKLECSCYFPEPTQFEFGWFTAPSEENYKSFLSFCSLPAELKLVSSDWG